MSPPGRRRAGCMPHQRLLSLIIAILLFLSPSAFAQNAVLGLDVGTEYIKAALVKPGIPLEIVLTKDSKRKEASAIAFKPLPQGAATAGSDYPDRLYGGDALALSGRFPTDVYPHLKHLLGVVPPVRDSAIETYRKRYPGLELLDHAHNGTIAFKSKVFNTEAQNAPSFSVEELLGMELKGIRENAKRMAESEVHNTVITIPAFYTADERRAIEFAAELAGFRVMALISDGLAVGLNYATSRNFGIVEEGHKPEYHLVYDMGAGSTTATLLKMQGKKLRDIGRTNKTVQEVSVVAVGWDRSLGGDAMNDLLVNDMVEKFVQTPAAQKAGIEASAVKQHGRAMAKLWKEAERLRQVLSANTATNGFFEGLLDDVDFRYKISRAEFEQMASEIASRVGKPLEDALAFGKIPMANLTSVVLHGGAVRTPFIQTSLEGRVGDPAKLRGNVNADEAAVFGAAFKAAGLSPSFKVKEIRSNEVAAYNMFVQWTSKGKPRSQQVFVPTSQVGPVKQMPFKFLDDFDISISQKVPSVQTGEPVERPISEVKTLNLTASVGELVSKYNCARENISTILFLKLDPQWGLPQVTKGTVSCESTVEEKKSGGVMEGVKGMFSFGKKDKSADEGEDDEELEPLPEVSIDSTTTSTTSSSSTKLSSKSSSSSTGKGDKNTAPVKKLQVINIGIDTKPVGLPQTPESELSRIKEGLAAFDRSDEGRRWREELFNGLEAFTYKVRDMLTDKAFKDASNATERSDIENLLSTTNDWLHGEGASAGIDLLKEKMEGLKALVDPVTNRQTEAKKRPLAVQRVTSLLEKTQDRLKKIKQQLARSSSSAAAAASSASDAASSAGESVASSAEEAVSSVVEEAAEAVTATEGSETVETATPEEGDENESAEPTSTITVAPPKYTPYTAYDPFTITDDDAKRLQSAYDSAADWLLEKIEAQELLKPQDNPVLLSSELEVVEEQLKKVNDELARKVKNSASSSSSSSSSSSRSRSLSISRSRASESSSKSKASAEAAASASPSSSATETSTESSAESSATSDTQEKKHDEL